MHLTYINITTLSINHINNTNQSQHRIYVVHPQHGATSTNSSSSLLSSFNLLTCTEPQNILHIGHEIYMHLSRSSFPELGHNTNPYSVCTLRFLQSLALSSASLNIQYAQSIQKYLHLAHCPLLVKP
jgi:hypothetical protein